MDDLPGDAPNGRRLNGWKEIADYFQRSVRTVQRWETELGLPVRRMGGAGRNELVTALIDDLEQWRKSAEAETARKSSVATVRPGDEPPAAPLPVADATPARVRRSGARRWIAASGMLLVVALAVAGVWWLKAAVPGEPSSFEVLYDRLSVRDAGGRVLWTHRFSSGLNPQRSNYRIVDLDGDGHQEVLALPTTPSGAPGLHCLYCLDFRGQIRWTYKQAMAQTFGSQVYAPPFEPASFVVTDAPNGKKFVWLVSIHIPYFPSVLHKIDAAGAVRGEYWSNGYISGVTTAQWGGRRVVLVGARNNEHESGSLALLDEDRPSGSAPAADPRYQCRTCPGGAPLAFVVFVRPRRLRDLSGTAPVAHMRADVNGSVIAWANFGEDFAADTQVFYTLDRWLRPRRVDTGDTFEAVCLELARQRKISPFRPGEGLDELRSVLWWDGNALVELKVPHGPDRGAE